MKKTLLAIALFASIGAASAVPLGNATTVSSGTVSTSCTFGTPTAGVLGISSGGSQSITNTTPATVDVTYLGTPTVRTLAPTLTSAPSGAPTPSSIVSLGSIGSANFTPEGSGSYQPLASGGGSATIKVTNTLLNGPGDAYMMGDYTITTVVSCE